MVRCEPAEQHLSRGGLLRLVSGIWNPAGAGRRSKYFRGALLLRRVSQAAALGLVVVLGACGSTSQRPLPTTDMSGYSRIGSVEESTIWASRTSGGRILLRTIGPGGGCRTEAPDEFGFPLCQDLVGDRFEFALRVPDTVRLISLVTDLGEFALVVIGAGELRFAYTSIDGVADSPVPLSADVVLDGAAPVRVPWANLTSFLTMHEGPRPV